MDCYIYISFMKKETDILNLMNSFKENNKKHDITGILFYNHGNILQLFEGPIVETKQLYENIKKDPRHTKIIKLFHHTIQERYVPDWTMQFTNKHRYESKYQQLIFGDDLSLTKNKIKTLFDSFLNTCTD